MEKQLACNGFLNGTCNGSRNSNCKIMFLQSARMHVLLLLVNVMTLRHHPTIYIYIYIYATLYSANHYTGVAAVITASSVVATVKAGHIHCLTPYWEFTLPINLPLGSLLLSSHPTLCHRLPLPPSTIACSLFLSPPLLWNSGPGEY